MENPSKFLEFAIKIAKEAGDIQMSYFGKISSLDKKSTNIDLVTNADIESEELIIKRIKESFPDHSILSEEKGELIADSDYLWVIDPLDGTTNFTHNLPIFAVSIGLIKKNTGTVCGVVYNPAVGKCFYAEKNKGAYLDGKKIQCTSSDTLSNSLLVTGFPYLHDLKYDLSFEIFKEFYDKTRGLRRLGAASLDLCFVAMGRFDGYYEYSLKAWDICAGSLIAEEAGAKVTDWDNSKLPNDGSRILATNGLIHNQIVKILTRDRYKIYFTN
ncbi:MAG: inositol monophosphatase [Candidatus Marinimicrobia bacterium]|nr:inositol monophosphatase [Candidatus Neomarinimicrobiota bacterium]